MFSLQFEGRAKHRRASTEAIVEAIGVDAVEDGVGIAALIQEVVKFETKNKAFELVLCRGVEERHTLVLVGRNLTAYIVVVQGEIEGCNREHVDGTSMGQ